MSSETIENSTGSEMGSPQQKVKAKGTKRAKRVARDERRRNEDLLYDKFTIGGEATAAARLAVTRALRQTP